MWSFSIPEQITKFDFGHNHAHFMAEGKLWIESAMDKSPFQCANHLPNCESPSFDVIKTKSKYTALNLCVGEVSKTIEMCVFQQR